MNKKPRQTSKNQDPEMESSDSAPDAEVPQQKEMDKQPEEIQKKRKLRSSDGKSDGNVVKRPARLPVKHKDTDESAVKDSPKVSNHNADSDKNGGIIERESSEHAVEHGHKDMEIITISDDDDHIEQAIPVASNSNVRSSGNMFEMPKDWNATLNDYRDNLIKNQADRTKNLFLSFERHVNGLTNEEVYLQANTFVQSQIIRLRNAICRESESSDVNIRMKRYLMLEEAMKRNSNWKIPAYLLCCLDEYTDVKHLETRIITKDTWPVEMKPSSRCSSSKKSPKVLSLKDVSEEGSSFRDDLVPVEGTKDQKSKSDSLKPLRVLKVATYIFEDDVYNSLVKMCKSACEYLAKGDKNEAKKLEEERLKHLENFKQVIEGRSYTEIIETANAFAIERTTELLFSEEKEDNALFQAYLALPINIANVTFCVQLCWIQSQRDLDGFRAVNSVVMLVPKQKPHSE